MESNFKVPLTKVLKVENHPGADRLDLITVYGFQVVASKGQYKVDDVVIYVPIDSILPYELEKMIFGKDSKIKLHNNRVRQIRIRGLASQGLLINPSILGPEAFNGAIPLEYDISKILGITKYEPKVPGPSHTVGKGKSRSRTYENKLFHKYNGLTALKWVPTIFEGEEVIIQCKLHGTNARAGIVPYEANNLWKKFKKLIGLAPSWEKCYGSNNVEVSAKTVRKTGYYSEDVYGKAFKSCDAFSKIKQGEIVYGEIVGEGIQKNYNYGHMEPHFVLFDVKTLQSNGSFVWMNPEEVESYAKERGFDFVPVLYRGIYDKDIAYKLTFGPSVYCPAQKVREGIVIKARYNYSCEGNKRAYKLISEQYLEDKTNTDNH